MAKSFTIPTEAPTDLHTFTILSDGQAISRSINVMSIVVHKAVNKIAHAQIMLLDGDPSAEEFKLSSQPTFIPGKKIEIKAGYHSKETTVFKGIIVKHAIKARKQKPSYLVLEIRDEAVKMTIDRKNKYFIDLTDSDIMEQIIKEYGLQTDVKSTSVSHKKMIQYYATDWDFIVSRAEKNGALVITDDGKVSVNPPDVGQSPALSLLYGATLYEFEAEMDARYQYTGVNSSSWNATDQAVVTTAGQAPPAQKLGNLASPDLAKVIGLESFDMHHSGQVADTELQEWANARLLKSSLARICGRARSQGFSKIKPGNVLELQGLGDRFNGNAFVTAVRHEITSDNWETDIQFGISPEWFTNIPDIVDMRASGLVPGVNGLQIGIVTQLQDDPDGEDRVLVKVPLIDPDEQGIWARVATLDAGNERGSFFRPEIGDEVVLAYLNDDPRDPIILGMLNSSAKPAPLPAKDDNHEKGFFTRSKMKVVFNDDKKSIHIETPNGNIMTISDDTGSIEIKDENNNIILMDKNGISMTSDGKIDIKAAKDVSVEGLNVNQKAQANFKAEGAAGAEMSSSATAVVKGSLVQIN